MVRNKNTLSSGEAAQPFFLRENKDYNSTHYIGINMDHNVSLMPREKIYEP